MISLINYDKQLRWHWQLEILLTPDRSGVESTTWGIWDFALRARRVSRREKRNKTATEIMRREPPRDFSQDGLRIAERNLATPDRAQFIH
jgi:hypothetical protein